VLFCVVLADGMVDWQEGRGFTGDALKSGAAPDSNRA
jgi:hypothetical protein